MGNIQPEHVFITLVTVVVPALATMIGVLNKISRAITSLEMKVDMVWDDFTKRKNIGGD